MNPTRAHAVSETRLPEIIVVSGSPPPARAASRRKLSPRLSLVLDKAASLPPGGWFVCPSHPLRDGFAASRTNKSGRDEFFLTERGTSAAFEVLRQERT